MAESTHGHCTVLSNKRARLLRAPHLSPEAKGWVGPGGQVLSPVWAGEPRARQQSPA